MKIHKYIIQIIITITREKPKLGDQQIPSHTVDPFQPISNYFDLLTNSAALFLLNLYFSTPILSAQRVALSAIKPNEAQVE